MRALGRCAAYVHADRDAMVNLGEIFKLDEEALSLFKHALTELKVDLEINDDGTYVILQIHDGMSGYGVTQ